MNNTGSGRIILVGLDAETRLITRALRRGGLSVTTTIDEGLAGRLAHSDQLFDGLCIVASTNASRSDALSRILDQAERAQPGLASLVLTETEDVRHALAAGATFALPKASGSGAICTMAARVTELTRLRRASHEELAAENRHLRSCVAEANATVHRYERDMHSIELAAAAISSAADPQHVLREICRAAVELFAVDHSGLVVFDATRDSGIVRAEYPADRDTVGTTIPVRGVPIEERLVYERQPVVIDSVAAADPAELGSVAAVFEHFGIRSILIVPIVSGGRTIGSFSLDAIAAPRSFSAKDVGLCRIFAAQIAAAIDKDRLLLDTRRQATEFDLLRQTTLALSEERNPERWLHTIVMRAVELLHARGGGIYSYDHRRGLLELQAAHGYGKALLGAQLRHDEGVAGTIVAQDLPFLIVPDYPNWPQRAAAFAGQSPFEAVVAVPLRWADRTLGVLFVDAERGRVFTAQDAGLLRFLADHAAIALGNATRPETSVVAPTQIEQLVDALDAILSSLTSSQPLAEQLAAIVQHSAKALASPASRLDLAAPMGFSTPARISIGASDALSHHSWQSLTVPPALSGTTQPLGTLSVALSGELNTTRRRVLGLFASLTTLALRAAPTGGSLPSDSWQLLFDAMPGAMIVNDAQGVIRGVTERAAALLGRRREQLMGASVQSVFADARVSRRIGRLLHEAPARRIVEETTLKGADNTPVPVRLSVARIYDTDDRDVGVLGYIEDLRALHAAEGRLKLLVAVNQLITDADGLPEAVRSVGDKLLSALGVAFCRIYLRDAQGRLVLQAAQAVGKARWHFGLGETVDPQAWPALAAVLDGAQPLLLDVGASAAWLHAWATHAGLPPGQLALLLMPLRDRGGMVGLIELGRLGKAEQACFTPDEGSLVAELANHIAPLFDRLRLQERSEHYRLRLDELERSASKLHIDTAPAALRAEVVRLAVDILEQSIGVLYAVRPQLGELEVVEVHGLPKSLLGRTLPLDDGLIGKVVRKRLPSVGIERVPGLLSMDGDVPAMSLLAVPLEYGGELSTVLLVGGIHRDPTLLDIDLSTLARFALRASTAMASAQLLGREQRRVRWGALRGQLSRFCQETHSENNILHAFLTALTAGYGLRFNRAALFLLNDKGDSLIGRMAVGNLSLEAAACDWVMLDRERGGSSFQSDLELLAQGKLPVTPLHNRLDRMVIPVGDDGSAGLVSVLINKNPLSLSANDLDEFLPPALLNVLGPRGPMAIVPLVRVQAEGAQGVLLVDNAFTQAPIDDEDCDALLAFAQTTAVARHNRHLLSEYEATKACLGALLPQRGDPEQGVGGEPEQLLHAAVAKIHRVIDALWVNIFLINELHEVRQAISSREDIPVRTEPVRKNGISVAVLDSGEAQIFEQTEQHRERLQPIIFTRGAGAAACLPLAVGERRIGVVWIHWSTGRHCLPAEIQALRLYLNQVAEAYDNACRISVLEQIRRAAESVAGAESWQDVVEQIARHGSTLLRGNAAMVWALDPADGRMVPERSAAFNFAPELWQQLHRRPPLNSPMLELAIHEGWYTEDDLATDAGQAALGAGLAPILGRAGARAAQVVALRSSDVVRGMLIVLYSRPQRFAVEDRRTAELFGNYAAMVLRQADLREILLQTNDRLNAAQKTVRLVTDASVLEDLGGALTSIVDGTRSLLEADTAVIYACDPQHRYLTLAPIMSGVRDRRSVAQKTRVLRGSLVTAVMEQKEIMTLDDVGSDPRFGISHFVRHEGIVSCAASPLFHGELCVGALFVSYRQPHVFTHEEREHIRLLANQAAIVIRTGQLFRERGRRVATLEAIQRAGQAVSRELVRSVLGQAPLEATLQRIVEQALQLLAPDLRKDGFSHLWLVEGTMLRITAAHPPEHLALLQQKLDEIDLYQDEVVGISGRAVKSMAPIRVDNVHVDPDYLCYDDSVNAQLAVPIVLGERAIGTISLEHRREAAFDAEDERALQALADYAASTIQNMRLYTCLETVGLLGRKIALNEKVDQLLSDLCRELRRTCFPGCLVTLRQRDTNEERPSLIFDPAWSSGGVGGGVVLQAFGDGVCGYVAKHRVPVNCADVQDLRNNPRYVELSPKPFVVRSELCVPIFWNDNDLFGVLDVQSPRTHAFTHDDIRLLEIVAAQVAVALQSSHFITSLQSMHGVVGGRAALAWTQTVVEIWRHEIDDCTTNILNQVRRARKSRPPELSYETWMDARLDEIDANANRIIKQANTTMLSAAEEVSEVRLDELIYQHMQELWHQKRYKEVVPAPSLDLASYALVRVNPQLLCVALEMLVRNAVEAMNSQETRHLHIVSWRSGDDIEVHVHDTGPGIPPEVRAKLFRERIVLPRHNRLRGTGLMMARAILQAYGGNVEVVRSDARGTVMRLTVPGVGADQADIG